MRGWRAAVLLVFGLALTGGFAGLTWACVPQPMLLIEPRASADVGDAVTARGLNFGRPAEIRFNGVSGPLLRRTSGKQFRATVRIPRARPGLYTLVALTRDEGGAVSGIASAPLQIGGGREDRTAGPTSGAGSTGSGQSEEDGISPTLATGGGLGLLLLGGLTGVTLARRPRSAGRT